MLKEGSIDEVGITELGMNPQIALWLRADIKSSASSNVSINLSVRLFMITIDLMFFIVTEGAL